MDDVRAAEPGSQRWRDLRERFYAAVRRALPRFGGGAASRLTIRELPTAPRPGSCPPRRECGRRKPKHEGEG